MFNPTYLSQYSSFLLAQIYTALHAQWPKVKQLFKEDARQEAAIEVAEHGAGDNSDSEVDDLLAPDALDVLAGKKDAAQDQARAAGSRCQGAGGRGRA